MPRWLAYTLDVKCNRKHEIAVKALSRYSLKHEFLCFTVKVTVSKFRRSYSYDAARVGLGIVLVVRLAQNFPV